MNNDCLFNCIIYYKINTTIKCLLICKQFSNLNTKYFWLLKNKMDFPNNKQFYYYYDNYKLYYGLDKLKIKFSLKISLYEIYIKNNLSLSNKKFQSISTEIGHPVRDEPTEYVIFLGPIIEFKSTFFV